LLGVVLVGAAVLVPLLKKGAAKAAPHEQWRTAVDEALPPLAAGETEAALTGLADRCADFLAKPFPPGAPSEPPQHQRFHQI
jgi:hypothetical protein